MKLSKGQFGQALQENQLVISLIGMSNIGKSYWSKKLCNLGFGRASCDDLIEARLGPVLTKLGYAGITDVARWMGQPYEERSPANQAEYLSLEKEILENVLHSLEQGKAQNFIIDTTGSVVHTGAALCSKLQQCTLVVYLEATEDMREQLFNQYIKEPKPVVFGDMFNTRAGETNLQVLQRCYRELLDWRSTLYAQYADVIIPRAVITSDMDANQFITVIRESL